MFVFGVSGGFPGGSDYKQSACNAGNPGLIPGSGRSHEERNGNPFQYFCMENSMDRGAGGLQSIGSESDMTEQLTFSLFTGLPWWLSGKRIHLPMQETRI